MTYMAQVQSFQVQFCFVTTSLGCDFPELDIFPVRIGIVTRNLYQCA